jgi:carboxymethylenebutenolidase
VLHDVLGLTDVTRKHADWLTAEAYLAIAPNLFSWGPRLRCIRALMTDLSARKGEAFQDVDAARQGSNAGRIAAAKPGSSAFVLRAVLDPACGPSRIFCSCFKLWPSPQRH